MTRKSVGFTLLALMGLHILFVVNRTGFVHKQMPQFVRKCERLPRLPRQLLDDNDRAGWVIQGETENRVPFGNLPFSVVAIATKHKYTPRLHRSAIAIKAVFISQAQPPTGNFGRFTRLISWKVWRGKRWPVSVV